MLQPFVSVLVPVRNEERYVERCLYSIASQDYPRARYEVLLIDGRSDDRTRAVAGRFAAESTLDLRLIDNPRRSAAAALNLGLREARGEVIVRVDGHATIAPDYLRQSVDALYTSGADCVGGVLESEGDTYVGRVIALAMSSRFGVGGAAFRVGGAGPVDTVAFGAYRRDVFARIGPFAEDIDRGEDDEFNYRLRDAGGLILLEPSIRASYTVRGDLRALWRQYFGYGRAKPLVLERHPAQAQVRQFAPAAFVLTLVVGGLMALAGKSGVLKLAGGVYALAATIASLILAPGHGLRLVAPLPAAFLCLHVSYGLGFLATTMGLAARRLGRPSPPGAHQSTEAPETARGSDTGV